MSDTELLRLAEKHLAALGDTPDEVAASLLEQGFTGCRRKAHVCPVANFLTAQLGVPVNSLSRLSSLDAGPGRLNGTTVFHPKAVVDFVDKFDDGHYPALAVTR